MLFGSRAAVGEWSTATPTVSDRSAITVDETDSISIVSLARPIVGVILVETVRPEEVTPRALVAGALPGIGRVGGLLSRAGEERTRRGPSGAALDSASSMAFLATATMRSIPCTVPF